MIEEKSIIMDVIINKTKTISNELEKIVKKYGIIKFDNITIFLDECNIGSNEDGNLHLTFFKKDHLIGFIDTEYSLVFYKSKDDINRDIVEIEEYI